VESQLQINSLAMLAAGIPLVLEGAFVWRRVPFKGFRLIACVLWSFALAAFCSALVFAAASEFTLRLAALWEVLGTPVLGIFFFLFTAHFTGLRRLSSKWLAAVLISGAAFLVAAVAVYPGLVYLSGYGLNRMSFAHESVGRANGPLFWVFQLSLWTLVVAGIVILLVSVPRRWRMQRGQTLALLAGAVIVVGSQLAFMFAWEPLDGGNASLLTLALGALPILWALPGLRLFDVRTASQRHVLEVMSDAVIAVDSGGQIVSANPAAEVLLVAASPEGRARGRLQDYVALSELTSHPLIAARSGEAEITGQPEFLASATLAGEVRHFDVRLSGLGQNGESETGRVIVLRDATQRVAAERALRDSGERQRVLFEQSPLGGMVFDKAMVAQEVNERFAAIVGRQAAQLAGKALTYENVSNLADVCRAALSGEAPHYSGPIATSGGGERWVESQVSPLRTATGEIRGGICLVWDVTESRKSEAVIERLSLSDTLTGLANRSLFHDRLRQVLADAARSALTPLVLICNLDHFARVNEALGHADADHLLQAVGRRLSASLRRADTLARWGGDEFAVLVPSTTAEEGVFALAERVLGCFREPWLLKGRQIWLTASVGVACYPRDGKVATELIEHAVAALGRAKQQGRNCARFYAAALESKGEERLSLASDLHRALDEQQLVVHYQPQIDARRLTLCGCEALVRWQHPERGLIPPAEFIPLAEEIGLIAPIGEWVLRTACAQASVWRKLHDVELRMGVNLSARQLQERGLARLVAQVLRETGLPARLLELEVTETVIIADPAAAAQQLKELATMGVSIALDDFGTGYSSLSFLRELPINRLKIDRSFIAHLPGEADAVAIARGIIDLAKSLGLAVVAEGVETAKQFDFLASRGCDEIQGYLFGRPVAAEEFDLRPMWVPEGDQAELVSPRGVTVAPAGRLPRV
jgi:diguanylate cyclase (GGDEF)-like protein/PAS domain S-box-containing protein